MSSFADKMKAGLQTALGVPEIKQKVLAATSNEGWGPTGTQMSEIADSTHHYADFGLIMETIWERLNDHGKYWKHVYKALLLLDYLIKNGAEGCVREARVKIIEIKTLTEFQHIDAKDKDVGLSVRERAKAIVELLHDERRLNEERTKARSNRGKFSQSISSEGGGRSYMASRSRNTPSYAEEYPSRSPSSARRSPASASRAPTTTAAPASRPGFDLSDEDQYDDYSDEEVPAPTAARAPAATAPPARTPAPQPAPLLNLLDEMGPPPTTASPYAPTGFATAPPSYQPTPTTQFPFATPPPTQSPLTFPGTGYPTATPQYTVPGAPVGTAPTGFSFSSPTTTAPSSGFTFPSSIPTTTAPTPITTTPAATPLFYQPTSATTESDWSDFQGSAAKAQPEAPKKSLAQDDPWARKDLFNFDDSKKSGAAPTTGPPKPKTPMGAAGPVKTPMGQAPPLQAPTVGGNPFGMTTPTAGVPGMMVPTATGLPPGYGYPTVGGQPAAVYYPGTMGPGMMVPMGASMGAPMGAYPGYGAR